MTNKGTGVRKNIILSENQCLVSDQNQVCNTFNTFFVNVAKKIGIDSIDVNDNHPSIVKISECVQEKNRIQSNACTSPFSFQPVDADFVSKCISKLDIKKATGIDGISAKIMKLSYEHILKPLTNVINFCYSENIFPDRMKIAQVVPLHKKNSILEKGNYRPVSILPTLSKIFERVIHSQLSYFFNNHFHDMDVKVYF